MFKEEQCDSDLQVDMGVGGERDREGEKALRTMRAMQPNPEAKEYWSGMDSWQWEWQGRDLVKHSDLVISVTGGDEFT